MDTLRGIFPKPTGKPKRNFIKENVMRADGKPLRATKPKTKKPRKLLQTIDRLPVITEASRESRSVIVGQCSSAASSTNRSSIVSTTRETSSQTGDINDDLFLKDVIIRIPTARVLDQQKSAEDHNENGSGRGTVSNRSEKTIEFVWDKTGSGELKAVGEFQQQRNAQGAIPKEFSRKNSVAKSKELSEIDEVAYLMSLRRPSNREFEVKALDEFQQQRNAQGAKSIEFKRNKTGSGELKTVDEFRQQRNAQGAIPKEFSRKNSIAKSKEFDDFTEFSEIDRVAKVAYLNGRRRALLHSQQAATKQQQDSPVYEEHTSIRTGSSNPSSLAGSSRTATSSKIDLPASYRVGELPTYLKEMNERKAERLRAEAEMDPNCPEGCVVLSEHDRMEGLQNANTSIERLIDELNRMPLTSETLKMKQRKIEIEKQLTDLEKNVREFSRLKIYVKIDE